MKILLLGGGAREHAIAWALSRSPEVSEIYAAPGNPGIATLAEIVSLDICNGQEVKDWAVRHNIDLVVIGPEAPLVAGVADVLRQAGIMAFGPGRDGAMLEGSKAFSKTFMKKYDIPTGDFDICTDMEQVKEALDKREAPYIVKADGLAAGKGAFVIETYEEALSTAEDLLIGNRLGDAGKTLIIEDCLKGTELTVLAITDGNVIRALSPSQDHKRVYDNDKGPNTGGMGAYSPVPWASKELMDRINTRVLIPTIEGLKKENIDFCGVIYAGLMIDRNMEPQVIEYNVRFGDPEAQVVLPVLKGDLLHILEACCKGCLSEITIEPSDKWAADVVIASGGYPAGYEKGIRINGLDEVSAMDDVIIFHAGTGSAEDGSVVTNGGRVLSVVGIHASDLGNAVARAYEAVERISFDGMHFRKDIASKARTPFWRKEK